MNHLKKLGLVGLLVTAAMSVAGVSGAAAEQSVLCKANETPCKSENRYAKGTGVALELTGTLEAYASNGAKFFGCGEFDLEGEVTAAGGSAETAEMVLVSQEPKPCTCTIAAMEVDLKFNWVSGTMNGAGTAEEFEFSFYCPSIQMGCAFRGEVSEGITLTGGSPAVLTLNIPSIPRVGSNFLCGEFVSLTGEFDVTTPNPLYVSTA